MKKKAKELEQAKAGLSKKDMLLWIFLSFLLALALYLNYNYSQYSLPVRLLGWLMVLAIALPVALVTQRGRSHDYDGCCCSCYGIDLVVVDRFSFSLGNTSRLVM